MWFDRYRRTQTVKQKKLNNMTHVKFNRKPYSNFNFVDSFFNDFPGLFNNDAPAKSNGSVPVNIEENEKSYKLDVVAPGFEKADFKVSVDQQVLTISVEKKDEVKDETKKQVRREYSYRPFKRTFTVDDKIDSSSIEAQYVNGVLTLNLPKKETVKVSAKEISIQ